MAINPADITTVKLGQLPLDLPTTGKQYKRVN